MIIYDSALNGLRRHNYKNKYFKIIFAKFIYVDFKIK